MLHVSELKAYHYETIATKIGCNGFGGTLQTIETYLHYWITETIISNYWVCNLVAYSLLEALQNFYHLVHVSLAL